MFELLKAKTGGIMHSDFALETGDSHRICEDYGRANNSVVGQPFVIICDGCSDPRSPDVDFGARVLAKSVENMILLNINETDPKFVLPAVELASAQVKGLGLDPQSLDCTLMIARVINKLAYVDCWGDGAIIGVKKDGTIEVCELVFPAGFPFYPNYYTDKSRLANFEQVGEMVERHFELSTDGKTTTSEMRTKSPDTHAVFDLSVYSYVAITTDGIESFYIDDKLKGRQSQPMIEIAKEFGGFKNGNGQFVQRRFNSFIKTARTNKISHFDDITIGGIYLGE